MKITLPTIFYAVTFLTILMGCGPVAPSTSKGGRPNLYRTWTSTWSFASTGSGTYRVIMDFTDLGNGHATIVGDGVFCVCQATAGPSTASTGTLYVTNCGTVQTCVDSVSVFNGATYTQVVGSLKMHFPTTGDYAFE